MMLSRRSLSSAFAHSFHPAHKAKYCRRASGASALACSTVIGIRRSRSHKYSAAVAVVRALANETLFPRLAAREMISSTSAEVRSRMTALFLVSTLSRNIIVKRWLFK